MSPASEVLMRSLFDRPRARLLRLCAGWRPQAPIVILTAVVLFLLHAFDAFATLEIIARGGEEAWWPASVALKSGNAFFLTWKIGLAALLSAIIARLAFHPTHGRIFWWILIGGVLLQTGIMLVHLKLLYFTPSYGPMLR